MSNEDTLMPGYDPLHKLHGALAFLETAQRLNSEDIAEWRSDVALAVTTLRSGLESAAGLVAHAIEELHQLGYTVRDDALYPPEHLHRLAAVGASAEAASGETAEHSEHSA